jgi:hypothetical protein
MEINLDWGWPLGEGKLVWAVISVDEEDHEDSNVTIWRADSEEHLYDQVKKEMVGDDEEYQEEFEDAWGYKILPKRIGEVV